MNDRISFWTHFEEYSSDQMHLNSDLKNTQPTQWDDSYQRDASSNAGTLTGTKMREEPDQDLCLTGYSAFSSVSAITAAKTITEAREEPDQDSSSRMYSTFYDG